jgi:phenylalanyl-tRNA synthetase beta subunit
MEIKMSTKLTLEKESGRYEVEVPEVHLDIVGVFDLVESVLLAAGYHQESIRDYLVKE